MGKKEAPCVLADGKGAQTQVDCSTDGGDRPYEERIFDEIREASIAFVNGNPDDVDWGELAFLSYEDYDRGRAWWAIGYPESIDKRWYEKVTSAGLQGAVSPLHDGDGWSNGDKKKAHYHFLFYYPGKKSYAQFKELCAELKLVMPQEVNNLVGACRYLVHMDIQPDKRPEDRHKVRYSPEDIVTFGGFDVLTYLKSTTTQKTQVLRELRAMVRECDITAYHELVDYVCLKRPEYEFYMSQGDVESEMYRYVFSRYRSQHPQSENFQAVVAAIMASATGEASLLEMVNEFLRLDDKGRL